MLHGAWLISICGWTTGLCPKSPTKHGWVAWKIQSPNWGPGHTQNYLKVQNSKITNNWMNQKNSQKGKRTHPTALPITDSLSDKTFSHTHKHFYFSRVLKMQDTNLVQVQELWFSKPTMMVRTQHQLSLQTKTHIIGSFSSSSNAQVLHSSPALSSPPNQIPPRVPSPSPERIQANPTRTNRSDLPPPRSPTTRRPIQPLLRLLRRTRRLRSPKTPFKP